MLVRVQCDKFMSHGIPRGSIDFHPGLNVVLGNDNGSNSIGKSTFLMILDFVLGGTDYVEKCSDVMREVGTQRICFTFKFDGEEYHFARSTDAPNTVEICNKDYVQLAGDQTLHLRDYTDFLAERYGVNVDGLTWRGAVSRFLRIYKRDTLDEERPLQSAKSEKVSSAIESYMRLFNRYAAVDAQIKAAKKAKEEEDVFKKTTKTFGHVRAAKSNKDKEHNEEIIEQLKEAMDELVAQTDQGLLDLDSVTASRVAEINDELTRTHRELASAQAKLDSVRSDRAANRAGFKKSFSELERFFPAEDFKPLEEIEGFHKKITKILAEEFEKAESSLANTCSFLRDRITELNSELSEIRGIPNVSQAALKEYARLDRQRQALEEANRNYDKLQRLAEDRKAAEEAQKAVANAELLAIEEQVNPEMKHLTQAILEDERHMAPVLRLENLSKYRFSTPNDGGTGAQHRSLITFDLANMKLTPLPIVIHDSVLLKNIERVVLSRIFECYSSMRKADKQVFIAFDSVDSYSDVTQELLHTNTVLRLSPDGNELFGWAWNKETDSEDNDDE